MMGDEHLSGLLEKWNDFLIDFFKRFNRALTCGSNNLFWLGHTNLLECDSGFKLNLLNEVLLF